MYHISIDKNQRAKEISPLLYGIFFEDINYAGDGGLYAELVANRSFAYYDREEKEDLHAMCWATNDKAELSVSKQETNDYFAKYIAVFEAKQGGTLSNAGFCNEGFYAKEQSTYRFTCFARSKKPASLTVLFEDEEVGKAELVVDHAEWKKYELAITARKTVEQAKLTILAKQELAVEFAYISLFPSDTFMGRKNGMRKDLAEMLKALSPKFMRFPGGCIVEGRSFPNMYRWKETIGDVWERRTNWNRWQMEEYQQEERHSLDYFQSYGIGFYEYFLLCEDIGATPVPVINCGMTCQWHESLLIPEEELEEFIQDALDLVEFVNGDTTTKWGSVRAKLGHPKPFDLQLIGIGNEQWGENYFKRYEMFEKAFKEKYPHIKLITCAGWDSEGADFDYAYQWMNLHKDKAYAVDEHFYKSPEWFLNNIHRYDNYDRTLPRVFAGEYATHTSSDIPKRKNNLYAALCEAAFLTGVEKNADHVIMSCYAPLFAREGHQQWQPDLIWFNGKECFGSPSYYVQKLFSEHTGNVSIAADPLKQKELEEQGLYMAISFDEAKKCTYVKLVNLSEDARELVFDEISGTKAMGYEIAGGKEDENSFANPTKLSILERQVNLASVVVAASSVLVLEIR